MNELVENDLIRKLEEKEYKIGYRYLKYVKVKNIRTVQKSGIQKYDKGRILIPNNLGIEPGDVILFEKIDEKTVKMIKMA